MKTLSLLALTFLYLSAAAQTGSLRGRLTADDDSVLNSTIRLVNTSYQTKCTPDGSFVFSSLPAGSYQLRVTSIGYLPAQHTVLIRANEVTSIDIRIEADHARLDEVVVTGVSSASSVKESPIPILTVPTRKIDQATESNVIDVLVKHVPGLTAVKTGPNISKPFIRGLGYNRVLTLYDGMRQEGQQWGDEHGLEVDAYNIDRAEVVKGPSSLIYGSDALAGVVGIIPSMPVAADQQLHGKLITEYQSNNGLIGNGLRLSYGGEHWSSIVRGSYRIAKSYQNAIDGRVYNTGFREANASGTLKYNNEHGFSTLNFTYYNNLQGIPDGSRDSLTRRFTHQIQEGNDDNIKNRPVVPDASLNSYALSPLHQHIQHYRLYTNNKYKIGNAEIEALLGFQQSNRREYTHPTAPEQAGLSVKLNTVNYGLNYNMPAFANTTLSFGFNGMYQRNKSKDATDFPIPDYSLFEGGIFGYAKWKRNKWTLGGGLRYDQRNVSGDDFYTRTDLATGFDQHAIHQITSTDYLQFPAFKKRFTGVSLGLGTTYQANDQISFKANIARGYRAPNITELAANGLDPGAHIIYRGNPDFNPEFSLQQDLGFEMTGTAMQASLSIFNNNINDYIFLTLDTDQQGNALTDAQGNKTYEYQQGKAHLYGLEAIWNLQPPFWNGFSFDNALTITYGYNRNPVFKNQKTEGEYLPLIPPVRVLSSISQDIAFKSEIISKLNLKAEGDFSGRQNRYLGLNGTETATASYLTVNLAAGLQVRYSKGHNLQFQIGVNNLFDAAYQSNLNRLKYFEYYNAAPGGRLGIYNMGRSFNFKLIAAF
ncbi:TonB-dependent receptor [Arcticibacter sp.]|uniref:TonB-dependent receptor n=1 Tax=Arcticibacter sp. TaxID=1872630 RepID=UPI0038910A4F